MKLSEVFPGLRSETWPWSLMGSSGPPYERVVGWFDQLTSLELTDIDMRISDGVVALGATLKCPASLTDFVLEFVTARFPSFELTFRPGASWSSAFRASVAPDGSYSFEIDELPLSVDLPGDLLAAHPQHAVETEGVTLTAGAGNSTIEATFRLSVQDGVVRLDPYTPISLGPCTLTGIPLLAIHDLRLIAAPAQAHLHYDWVVKPLDPSNFPFECGGIGFGGLMIDWQAPTNPLREVRPFLTISDKVEWVFEDIVIPAVFFPPLPQHGTFGLRRSLLPGESLASALTVDHHVMVGKLSSDVELFLDQLFFRTLPDTRNPLDGLSLEGGVSIAYGADPPTGAPPPIPGTAEPRVGIAIGIIDGDLIRLTVERALTPQPEEVPVLHLEFFDLVDIDIVRGRIGFSASMLAEGKSAGEALHLIGDIVVRGRPSTEQTIRVETEDGKPFAVALVGLGYDRGTFSGSLQSELGAKVKLGPFGLTLSELGLLQLDGASYFSISGGIDVAIAPFSGGLYFKRLRFKLWGSPDAPDWGLDGIGGKLEIKDVVSLEFYGFYTNKLLPSRDRIKEHGLVGKLVIYISKMSYGLSFDFLYGELFPASGAAPTSYFLIQILFEAQLAIATAEMRSIRVVVANNMLPNVSDDDRGAGELVYYKWLKSIDLSTANPVARLAAWKPTDNAIAFGMGFGVSFVGCGNVILLKAFGLGFDSDEQAGLVIALEVFLLGSKKPLALGVFEYDFKSGAFVILIAFDISLKDLIENFPDQLTIKLSGTIVIGNQPGLIAFGRYDDVDTWVGAKATADLASVIKLDLFVAVCFEWLEDVHVAAGFLSRVSLKADLGIVMIEGWSTLEVRLAIMCSGTSDFAARILFELGLALTLFRFLRLGLVLEAELEWLAHSPDYLAISLTVRIETPWFLPDISFTVEHVEGDVAPSSRPLIAALLLSASATGKSETRALRIARVDGLGADERPRLMTLDELGSATASYVGDDVPVPLDAVIAIELSDTIADMLGLGEGPVGDSFGTQRSGEDAAYLETRYELVGLEVRRRPLGTDAPWTVIESLATPRDAKKLRWQWDQTKRVGDQVAPKRLLLNGATPFFAQLDGPLVDESILQGSPSFPCCGEELPGVLRFDVGDEPATTLPSGFVRRIASTHVVVRGGPSVFRTPFGTGGEESRVAAFALPSRTATVWSRTLVQLVSPDDLAMVRLRVAMTARDPYTLHFRARDRSGTLVFDRAVTIATTINFTDVLIAPGTTFRTVEVVASPPPSQAPKNAAQIQLDVVELDHALVLTQDALERWERDKSRCAERREAPLPPTVNFLPQQEYEVVLRTQISASHSTTEPEATVVEERLAFVTAGPPGLNETEAAGEDLKPHVYSEHAGGRGLLYREEPINLVLAPELKLFGIGAEGEDEHGLRLPATLTIRPEIEPDSSHEQRNASFESEEWFASHREEVFLLKPWITGRVDVLDIHSEDPRKRRLEEIANASTSPCPEDAVWRDLLPSFWLLPFGPDGGTEWPERRRFRASLRRQHAPVVYRDGFVPADVTAFAGVEGGWRITDEGWLEPTTSGSVGYFGEEQWDHYRIVATVDVGASGSVGVLVLGNSVDADQGVRITISGGRLIAARGRSGPVLQSATLVDPPSTLDIIVETFADRIRCTAGGATVHVSRLGIGSGACAVLADAGSIRALHVRGIEMYGFNFETSRYASFGEHIASFEALESCELGDEARSLRSVLDELTDEIATVMRTEASDVEREQVFSSFVEALALPLREQVDRLRITEIRQGDQRALLIETPEAMDFVEEIDLTVERFEASVERVRREVVLPAPIIIERQRIGRVIGTVPPRPPLEPARVPPRTSPPTLPTLIDLRSDRLPPTRTTTIGTPIAPDLFGPLEPRYPMHPVEGSGPWVAQPIRIVQNALATKILIASSVGTFPAGRLRLHLAITRRWFRDDAPPTDATAYMREASVELVLGA